MTVLDPALAASAISLMPATPRPPVAIAPHLAQIEQYLDGCLDARGLPDNLLDACRYALLGGGKRLRPLLTLLATEAAGGERTYALPAAAATELIHAFSLVHDDLPAMDNDEVRRGMPTMWVKYGQAMAILAGDALQSLAFELLCDPRYSAELSGRLIRELSVATTKMIAGQVYDTLGGVDTRLSPREQLEVIHRNKTGALLCASCRIGALCAGADDAALQRLTDFGDAIGLMFQIMDDVLDVTQPSEHLGKRAGKDLDAGKMTFPGVLGLELSRREIARLHAAARQAIEPFGSAGVLLAEVADYLAIRTK